MHDFPFDAETALRALLRSTSDRVVFLDREGRQSSRDALEPLTANATRFDEQRRAVMTTGQPVRDETSFGDTTLEYVIAPVTNDSGMIGVVVVMRDISERRRAEVALRESESKFATAFDCSPLALTITSLEDGRLVEVNEGFVRLSGYTREEARGRAPEELGLWVDPSVRAERFARFRQGLPVPDVEARFRVKNGEILVGVIASAVVEINGRPCVLSSVVDITERKHFEEALRESEARIREFADSAPAILWTADASGACTFLSRGWYEFTGQSVEQSLGAGWLDPIHPDDRAVARDTFAAAYEKREPVTWEYRIRRHDGEYRWIVDSARPRFGANGEFLGYVGNVIDITERKRAEQAKDEFLATLSHELRTPLTSAFGWVKLLARTHDPELLENGLHALEQSIRHQIRLIDDLLDVSRIATGKMRLDMQPLDLGSVVDSAIEMIRPAAEAKRIDVNVHADCVLTLEGDPARLRQLVSNLLSNAIKFTQSGGRVDIELRQRGTNAELVVRDNGQGIDPRFLPYVFDRFRQADSSIARAYGGLGIGLSIVASVAEAHRGSVRADSDGPGRGAAFTVTIPLLESSLAPALPRESQRAKRTPLAGARVLVVDDDDGARRIMATTLTAAGAEVFACASASEAYAAFGQWQPHVLVSDLAMPQEDGYSLVRTLRQTGNQLPALAITAYGRDGDEARVRDAGFHRYLAKPFEPDDLVRTVHELAGRADR